MANQSFLVLFLIAITVVASVAIWMGVVWLFSRLGKWQKLASVYAVQNLQTIPEDAEKRMINFLTMGFTQYKGVVRIFATSQGIFLRPIFIFKYRHPLLFIPWRDIEEQEKRMDEEKTTGFNIRENLSFLWRSDKFIFRNAPDIKVCVDANTGAFIREKKKQFHF